MERTEKKSTRQRDHHQLNHGLDVIFRRTLFDEFVLSCI
jgi:hypothetical protein